MLNSYLTRPIDNTFLILFRILFGLLAAIECWGALALGWVNEVFVDPIVHFPFIGFEFLIPVFTGPQMVVIYALMGLSGLLIALGKYYRMASVFLALFWTISYLMQKVHYNNHYYLFMLLAWIMTIMPVSKRLRGLKPSKTDIYFTFRIYKVFFIFLLFIMYSFASINKIQPDWIAGKPIAIWFANKSHYPLIGALLQNELLQRFVVWGGILFDGLIIPALLWKKTKNIAFAASVVFHLFNSVVFQIGIFPYLSLAFHVFFFDSHTLRRVFLMDKWAPLPNKTQKPPPLRTPFFVFKWGALVFLFVQILLPLRNHLWNSDVNWSEEGHRLSWRMMLRTKSGTLYYKLILGEEQKVAFHYPEDVVGHRTAHTMASHPDMIWQYAQYLLAEYMKDGYEPQEIQIYALASLSLNGGPKSTFVDPSADLSQKKWSHWKSSDWILPQKQHNTQR